MSAADPPGRVAPDPVPGSFFRELVETVPALFFVSDAQGCVQYLSPAFEPISGFSPEGVYGRPNGWFDVMHPEDRPRVAELIAKGRGKGVLELEYRVVRPDGGVRWLEAYATEIRGDGGELLRVVGIAKDVTRRRELEDQLRQAQKMEAIGHLAGGVAHDFNNLLTVIIANVGLLRARFKAGDVGAQQLGEIDAAAQQAADLTRKLLGFSRRANLSLRPVRLGDIVGDVVALLRPTLDPKIELELAVAATDRSDVVVADRSEMCHVVLNLCLNARDAMLRGGRMSLGVGRCVVDAAHAARVPGGQAGDMVYLSVADTGPGIPREVVARIFEPFFTTKPTGEGTGLGLAVARGIVEQHQGFIECATSASGSCFTIYLPPHQGSRAPDAGPGKPPGAEGARRGETILFVDDEPPLRRLASRILGRNGYEVLLAADGAEAVAVFHAEIEAIDLVIVDLTMPRMSGVEVVQSLREIRPDVRIILSTGHIGDEARAVEQLRSVTVLPKPYTVDQLLGTVRRLLDEEA